MSDEQLASQPIGKLLADMETAANAWFPTDHYKRAIGMKVDALVKANTRIIKKTVPSPLLEPTDTAFLAIARLIGEGDLQAARDIARGMCGDAPPTTLAVSAYRELRSRSA